MTLNLPSSTLVPTNSSDSQLVDDRAVETAETVPEFHDPADALSADEVLDAIDTHTSEPVDPIVELLRPTGILLIGTHYTDADLHRAMQALPGALRGADHTLRELAIRRAAAILKAAGVEQPMQLIRGVAGNGADPSRDGIQGEAIRLAEPAPWDDAVSGADLLQQIQDAIGAYVVLPPGGAAAVTLWVLHAHAIEASAVSPLLAAVSPEKRCGKSTLLVVLAGLVPKPLLASNITPAVLFRTVEKYGPTLLVDEVDSFLGEREELRGLLNSGHHRAGAFVLRAVGDDFEPRAFSTWCPKAVALIGRPPATVEDRAVVLPMRRRRPDEALRRLRLDRLDGLTMLQRQAWRWAQDHLDQLRDADPDIPTGLDDRAADNWRPLLAVADLAGGPWPERAREAAQQLSGAANEGELAPRVQLLADLQALFHERQVEKLASEELVKVLGAMEDRAWMEWKRGRPITVRQVAGLLAPFHLHPKPMWQEGRTVRGYLLADCADAFARYLPSDPQGPQGWRNGAADGPAGDPQGTGRLADAASAEKPHHDSTLADLADEKGGRGQERGLSSPNRGRRPVCGLGHTETWTDAGGNVVCGVCHPRPVRPGDVEVQALVNHVIAIGMRGRPFAEPGKQERRAASLLGRWTLAELKQVADALPAGFPFTDGRTFDLFDVGKHADLVLAELHAGGCPGGPGTPEAEADAREPLRAQDKKAA